MTKRQKLEFNSEELTQNLKTSVGQGMNAFFSPPSPAPSKTPSDQSKPARPKEKAKRMQTSKRARMRPHTKKRTQTSAPTHIDAQAHARTLDELKRAILSKKHLSSFTFRFKAEELESLDRIAEEVNEGLEQKVSKNDVVRLSLRWLLKDYELNKQTSVLARVLASV